MTDKVQKIRKEVERLFNHVKYSDFESDSGAFYYLKDLLDFIDSLQEEPVSIWHDANQQPEINTPILVRTYDNIVESTKRYDDNLIPWEDRIKRDDITHWCYVEDLLKL